MRQLRLSPTPSRYLATEHNKIQPVFFFQLPQATWQQSATKSNLCFCTALSRLKNATATCQFNYACYTFCFHAELLLLEGCALHEPQCMACLMPGVPMTSPGLPSAACHKPMTRRLRAPLRSDHEVARVHLQLKLKVPFALSCRRLLKTKGPPLRLHVTGLNLKKATACGQRRAGAGKSLQLPACFL